MATNETTQGDVISPASGEATGTPSVVGITDGGVVEVPGGLPLGDASFGHAGPNLVITWPDGTEVVVEDFFSADPAPTLMSSGGARMSGEVVGSLAGPVAPGQVAAADIAVSSEPIGTVENVAGTVSVTRADGTRVELEAGDPVYQGDILETGADGAVGIVLADETSFAMGEDGRMVLDEMVYDPGTQEGSVNLAVVKGVFTFVSGQIAKADPDAMTIETPVATIGIRGTQVGVDVSDGENLNIVLMEEGDGFVGEVVVMNDGGIVVMNGANEFTMVGGYGMAPAPVTELSTDDLVNGFSTPLRFLPMRSGSENDYGLQSDDTADAGDDDLGDEDLGDLADFETAAGAEDPGAGGPEGLGAPGTVVGGDYGQTDAAGAPLTSESEFSVLVAPVNDAPELIINAGLDVDISLEAIIDSDLLQATDVDTDPSEIFYRITEGPDFGSLYLFDGEGNWVPVGEDGEGPFTQSDLNAGWLKYMAEGDEVPFSHEWAEGTPDWSGVSERQATTPEPVMQENLTVPDGATSMTVTFEHEGTGYKNTVGWYRIDEEGNPTEANILWNNASAYRSGGSLIRGESSVTIDELEPGEKIGLFVVNNGYNRNFTADDGARGKFLREVDEEWTAQFNADGDLTFTGPDRTFTIDADAGGSQGRIFHASLDPSANPDGLVHATSGVDAETGKLMVGFEDLYRGGDKDFDDIVVSVNYDGPPTIVESDSFSFTVDDGEPPADVDGGYSVADKEETFTIQVTETT